MDTGLTAKCSVIKGVGEGGQGVGARIQKWGAQVGLCTPNFWAEQMFLFHYLLIFCG